MWEGPEHILDTEARELHRREETERGIVNLPEDEREAAELDERRSNDEHERRQELMFNGQHPLSQDASEETGQATGGERLTDIPDSSRVYEERSSISHGSAQYSDTDLPPLSNLPPGPTIAAGTFKCDYAGCTAQPFQKQ